MGISSLEARSLFQKERCLKTFICLFSTCEWEEPLVVLEVRRGEVKGRSKGRGRIINSSLAGH